MAARLLSRRSLLHRSGQVIALAATSQLAAPAVVGRAEAAQVTLRMSSSLPNDPRYANGRVYHDFLVNQLGGHGLGEQIAISFFPDNQLGQEIDVANSVKLGVIDMMVTGTSIWANLVAELGLLDLGYLFESFPQQTKALDAGAAQPLETMLLRRANTRIAGWAYNFGSRSILAKFPFTEPEQLAGKKIRSLPNPVITELVRLMGAAATPLAFGEIYTALQAGVLDGLEHDPPTIVASKFNEIAKHYTLTQHIFSPLGIFLSEASLRRMPASIQGPFLAAAAAAAADTRTRGLAAEQEALSLLRQKGTEISECDRAAFRKRAMPQTEAFMKAHPAVAPIIELIRSTSA
jgi:TRAP-type C4-dicarboxylate transport system substrate-binding protein